MYRNTKRFGYMIVIDMIGMGIDMMMGACVTRHLK